MFEWTFENAILLYTLGSRVISLLRVCNSYWRFISDPRGLEVRGDGGRPRPAVAFLPRHHHRHCRHPHGRSPHLRVCRSGPHHRHLPGKVKKRQPMPKFSTSEFRKVFNGDDGFSRLTIWSKTQWSGFWQPLGGGLLEKPWDLVAFQQANSTLWVLCCQPLLAVEWGAGLCKY